MLYKAVIFDLDGTLLNTIEDIADSFNATLKKLNHESFSYEQYKYFVGRGIDELITRIIETSNLNASEFQALKSGYVEEYARRHHDKTDLYPGIMDLLVKLKKANVLVNVLSNKPHFQTVEVLKYYFKNFTFDQAYGKKDEFRIKPYPESALDLINKLNLKPEQILYVGDTDTDIQTAKNAGFDSVGVLWGFRKKEELIAAKADYIVSDPNQIYKIIVGDGDDFKSR